MPRYFFNIANNGSVVADYLGRELADGKAATAEALSFAEFIPLGAKIIVRDEVGRVVCEIVSTKEAHPDGGAGNATIPPTLMSRTNNGQED